ncbi:hypothetical protein DFH09DRAFT_1306084 [Mycena vulgaris]|nr:hypothetical protein DFH09DRAFT_1306084 [Mycena vulgaris]
MYPALRSPALWTSTSANDARARHKQYAQAVRMLVFSSHPYPDTLAVAEFSSSPSPPSIRPRRGSHQIAFRAKPLKPTRQGAARKTTSFIACISSFLLCVMHELPLFRTSRDHRSPQRVRDGHGD